MSKRVKSRWGVLAALAVAFVAVLAIVIGAVRPALAAGETMGHLASGANNGNAHFGGTTPEAFVLSDTTVGEGTVGADFVINSDPTTSRVRFVAKYVDDENWAFVGYDVSNNWFFQYSADGEGGWPSLSGLPTLSAGQEAKISVSVAGSVVTVDVNGETATVDNEALAGVLTQEGKVGFGGATYSTQYTDIAFTNVVMGDQTVTDFSNWDVYRDVEGQTWEPAYTPEVPEGRKWIQITGGSHNGGGHAYGNANTSAPLVLVDNSRKANNGETLSLTLVPESDTINFGIFYTYVDDSNWMYVGYDPSSKWYCQYNYNGSGSYPAFGGDLPTPEKGVPMEISISVNNEKVSLTVNGVTQSMSNQAAGSCTASLSGKGVARAPCALPTPPSTARPSWKRTGHFSSPVAARPSTAGTSTSLTSPVPSPTPRATPSRAPRSASARPTPRQTPRATGPSRTLRWASRRSWPACPATSPRPRPTP